MLKLFRIRRRIHSTIFWGFAAAVAVVLLLAAAAMGTIAFFSAGTADPPNPLQFVSNVLAPVTAGAAFLGVLVSIFSINANLRVAKETEQGARFQKASELISDDLQTAEVAGISLLQQLVAEDWSKFAKPSAAVLMAFIAESVPEGLEGRLRKQHLDHPFPRTRVGIIQAVRLINWIHGKSLKRRRKRGEVAITRANEVIYNLYLARWNREALTIRNLDFREMIASYWSMRGGFITDCRVEGRIGRKVRLTETRLHGTSFRLKRIDEEPLTPWDTDIVDFDDCEFDDGTTVNGYHMKDWVALAATPRPANPAAIPAKQVAPTTQPYDYVDDDGF